jgi:hypothetical protein
MSDELTAKSEERTALCASAIHSSLITHHLATFTVLFSLITVTFIWPG